MCRRNGNEDLAGKGGSHSENGDVLTLVIGLNAIREFDKLFE